MYLKGLKKFNELYICFKLDEKKYRQTNRNSKNCRIQPLRATPILIYYFYNIWICINKKDFLINSICPPRLPPLWICTTCTYVLYTACVLLSVWILSYWFRRKAFCYFLHIFLHFVFAIFLSDKCESQQMLWVIV